jgi:WhiB family redox-sensing transcriptional regulator
MATRSAAGTSYAPVGDWRDHAACLPREGTPRDPEWWWPAGAELSKENRRAIAICDRCPVRATCLDWALDRERHGGIWAGMTQDQREAERTVRSNAARRERRQVRS